LREKLAIPAHLCLEKLSNSSNTGKSENGHVNTGNASSTVIIILVVALGRTLGRITTVLTLVGLLVVGGTLLLAIDLLVVLKVVEELAEILDISGGGNNDTAANLVELGEFNPKVQLLILEPIFMYGFYLLLEASSE
jgi:hypothetical protein